MSRKRSAIVGQHENTDWFRYQPNQPWPEFTIQARWVDGFREFRHRPASGGSGRWIEGAPWDE